MTFYIRPTWPSTRYELDFWHGLAMSVEHDVVRLWLVSTNQSWKGPRRDRNNKVSIDRAFWQARCLLFEYKTGQGLSQRSYSLSSLGHNQHYGKASSPDTLSIREFEAHCNSGELKLNWWRPYDPDSYGNRHLARICRLICRDWAKQILLGDPKLRIANGAVWYCVEDVRRVLPKRHWAWEFRRIEWWMERRHQDSLGSIWRNDWKAWYPKLIQPIDDSVPSKDQEISTLSSLTITSKQYRTHLEPCFGPRFLENVRDMNKRELYRTCRLVCRDWARQFPVKVPGRGRLWLRGGVMWYSMEGDWYVLPSGYWAWALQDMMWWAERFCPELSGCVRMRCRCKAWYPKLLRPVDNTIRQNAEYSMPTVRSLKPPTPAAASLLPPKLIKYICKVADSESWPLRLVCRYWNEQCTPCEFEVIDINESPERIRALWRARALSVFRQHFKIVDKIPSYTEDSKFPWIHLLIQIRASTQAVWKWSIFEAGISLGNRDKRIRSIHYALPRSVPRSFSRGIRSLYLTGVKVRQIKDLAHLVCELPDLEKLECRWWTLDLRPAELPRRRPRKNRNRLNEVDLNDARVAGAESTPPLIIPMLSLFLSVYDTASFFSDEVVTVILAALSLAIRYLKDRLVCIYDEQTRQLEFHLLDKDLDLWAYFRFNVSSANNTTTLRVGIKHGGHVGYSVRYANRWKALDIMFRRLRSESLEVCTRVVFGFSWRHHMVEFAENVLGQLPSTSEHFTMQYTVHSRKEDKGWGWYQASLDSEELRGEPKKKLLDVYP